MTEGFYKLVMSLLEVADESAAQNMGLKGKPYLEFGEVLKHGFNIKKQDARAFEEIHKRVCGDNEIISFEEILKQKTHYLREYLNPERKY